MVFLPDVASSQAASSRSSVRPRDMLSHKSRLIIKFITDDIAIVVPALVLAVGKLRLA